MGGSSFQGWREGDSDHRSGLALFWSGHHWAAGRGRDVQAQKTEAGIGYDTGRRYISSSCRSNDRPLDNGYRSRHCCKDFRRSLSADSSRTYSICRNDKSSGERKAAQDKGLCPADNVLVDAGGEYIPHTQGL